MTRTQWLVMAFIGVLAAVAYNRSGQLIKYLGLAASPSGKITGTNI